MKPGDGSDEDRRVIVSALVDDLRSLGVRMGDVLMVHASLRAIGPVDGGAATLIEALDRAVGGTGTLLLVLGARDDWSWVNDRTEARRPALLADADPFDALTTPADPDVGTLAELFRLAADTVVSDHPEGRFAARGRLAQAMVDNPPWNDYYGPGSALERLVRARGKVLRLGADPDTVTLTHYAEYLAPTLDKRRVRRHRRVTTSGGPQIVVVDSLDDSEGIVDYPDDYFVTILTDYLQTRPARIGTVGNAHSELIDAADYVDFAVDWMTRHF